MKSKNGAIMKWDAELAKYAADVAAKEQMPTGSFVSVRGGVLSIGGQPMKDNKVEVVIVDHIFENAYYVGDFDPDQPQPPHCYAFERDEKELKPHEKAHDPQHDQCAGCPKNEFGTADKGKGKACKNTRRLAIISATDLSKESITDGALFYWKLPVTSVKGWASYAQGLARVMKRPPFSVITEIAVVPDPQTQFKLTFRHVGNVPPELQSSVMKRREKVMEEIAAPYGVPSEPRPKSKGKGTPKRTSKF